MGTILYGIFVFNNLNKNSASALGSAPGHVYITPIVLSLSKAGTIGV